MSNNIRPRYQLLDNAPRIPYYISDISDLQMHLLGTEKHFFHRDDYGHSNVLTPTDNVGDGEDDDNDSAEEVICIKCPISGCTSEDKDYSLWICCGVIACCECIVRHYEFKSVAICPWCGSVATDLKSFNEMIIPVENPYTCLLQPASLMQLKTDKGKLVLKN